MRTLRARTMHEALRAVKRELGEHAVILGTRTIASPGVGGLVGRQMIEITAATGRADAIPKRRHAGRAAAQADGLVARPHRSPSPGPPAAGSSAVGPPAVGTPAAGSAAAGSAAGGSPVAGSVARLSRSAPAAPNPRLREMPPRPPAPASRRDVPLGDLTDEVYPLYQRLVANEVADELARRIVRQAVADAGATDAAGRAGEPAAAKPDLAAVKRTFCDTIARMLPTIGGLRATSGRCCRVAFVGPAGAGKTTTIAKLAAHFRLRERLNVAIVSVDVHGLARHDQVRRYAEIIGVDLHTPQTIGQVRQTARQVADRELVLIDTCGVGVRDRGRVVRLAAMLRALRCEERHLVLPASMSATAQSRAAEALAPLNPSRLVLTRLDELVGMGVILNAVQRLDLSLSYVCDGQTVPSDIRPAEGQELAARLLA